MANSNPGPGVDAEGRPVIDPTQNVLDLVEAAIKRQDDLRNAESRHMREISELRAQYDRELREAESARIDAIRAVDVGAVNRAADVAAAQAETLRIQVATSAETLRTQVAASATAAAVALGNALDPLQTAIADLRRAQYEAQGVRTQSSEDTTSKRSDMGLMLLALAIVVSAIGIVAAVAMG